jgi:signal transduction histidine kinase
MSHEIRTPLTSILSFAQVLKSEVSGEHRDLLEMVEESGKRLLHLLNSVLDLAQLGSHAVILRPSTIDLGKEVKQAIDLLQPLARQKALKLSVNQPAHPVSIQVDPTLLQRILNNLVGNAIKYTEKGQVTIQITTDDEHAYIRVIDTGVGIDPAFLPYLFEEFKQASPGLGTTHEGSGLGLAITKQLVELLNGEILVDSKPGVGSAFTVVLPYTAPEPPDEPTEAPMPEWQ